MNVGEGAEEGEHLRTVGGHCSTAALMETGWRFLKQSKARAISWLGVNKDGRCGALQEGKARGKEQCEVSWEGRPGEMRQKVQGFETRCPAKGKPRWAGTFLCACVSLESLPVFIDNRSVGLGGPPCDLISTKP